MSPSIRAIFVDFGGVLYKTPNLHMLFRVSRLFGVEMDELIGGLYRSPSESAYARAIMSGQVSEGTVWETLARRLRFGPRAMARLRAGSYSPRRLNQPMLAFLKNLRPHYKTAILTNAASEFRSTFCQAFDMENWADRVLISAELKMVKPDPVIFYTAAKQMDVEPAEALFLDDIAENVAGARSTGMQAIQFLNNRQALADLTVLLQRQNEEAQR